jgi:anhydro-N-acetylmuramic acid kinase
MSGSALDGLDIAYVHFQETGGKWTYELLQADTLPYTPEWTARLKQAITLSALDYQLLHTDYGHYIGRQVNWFIETYGLHHKVDLVASHGHTSFHLPAQQMTGQLGDGAAIAAQTELPVVSDLRAIDVAFGGQGAPIAPIGEKLLLGRYAYFLNLGGIANISCSLPADMVYHTGRGLVAFDVCPANRVLNMLVAPLGKEYDEDGKMAARGNVHQSLLDDLNAQPYYRQPYPKSLANDFGTDTLYPLVKKYKLPVHDELRTCVEHIAIQVENAVNAANDQRPTANGSHLSSANGQLLATGGGALNLFLMKRIAERLKAHAIEVVIPEKKLVNYKEALIMALMGVLRWREEYNVLASVTGARRNTINGAVWLGNEA